MSCRRCEGHHAVSVVVLVAAEDLRASLVLQRILQWVGRQLRLQTLQVVMNVLVRGQVQRGAVLLALLVQQVVRNLP